MRKKNDTVRYTAKQIKAKLARGEDRSNWGMTGPRLETSIRAGLMISTLSRTGRRP
jgi:hypothetical protein